MDIEHRLSNLEKKLDRSYSDNKKQYESIQKAMNEHFRESEIVREQVRRHEKKLENGWAKSIVDSITSMNERLMRIENSMTSKNKVWKDILLGSTLVATLIGISYTVVQMAQLTMKLGG